MRESLDARYIALGLVFGAGLGAAFGPVIGSVTGDMGIWVALGVPLGAGIGLAIGTALGVRQVRVKGACPSCGYSTKGWREGVCPECGGALGSDDRTGGESDDGAGARRDDR